MGTIISVCLDLCARHLGLGELQLRLVDALELQECRVPACALSMRRVPWPHTAAQTCAAPTRLVRVHLGPAGHVRDAELVALGLG